MPNSIRRHVVLDLPPGWSELDNLARLRLLQRQAQYQHCHLALVTDQASLRKSAQQTGIPAYAERQDVPGDRWQMHAPYPLIDPKQPDAGLPEAPAWRRSDIVARAGQPAAHRKRQERIDDESAHRGPLPWWLRLGAYSLMALFMVGLLAAFAVNVLPAATITVTPGRESIAVAVPITADPDLEASDIEVGLVPGRLVEVTLENTGAAVTTGTQQKPVDKATGSVVFNNIGGAPVDIPRGTVVSTGTGTPVNFRTTQPAQLEGGIGQRVTVPIEAVEPGISGNVRANTINTVSGAMRFRARVSNPDGTGGGGSSLVSVVTQQDKDNLLAQVQTEVEAQAYESLLQELQPGEWMPPESVQIYTIGQAFDKFNDDEGDTVNLTLRSLVQGTAIGQEDAEEAILYALRENVPEDAMLVADSITYDDVSEVASAGRQVTFTMTGTSDYVVPIDPVELKKISTGLPEEEAAAAIAARWPLENQPEIYQDPDWLSVLPRFPNRIQVRIVYDDAGQWRRRRTERPMSGERAREIDDAGLWLQTGAPSGKLLALDVSPSRIGVAVCDPLQLAAWPVSVIERTSRRRDFEQIADLARRNEANAVICGLPLNMDGSEGDRARTVRKWAIRLAHALRALLGQPIPVIFWDERLSTYEANEYAASDSESAGEDAVAAAIILQRYLDSDTDRLHGAVRPEYGAIVLPEKESQPAHDAGTTA